MAGWNDFQQFWKSLPKFVKGLTVVWIVFAAIAVICLGEAVGKDAVQELRIAEALRDLKTDTFNAIVLDHGFTYRGTCYYNRHNTSFTNCNAGADANRLCSSSHVLHSLLALTTTNMTTSRRLRGHVSAAVIGRGGVTGCSDKFEPWFLISFEVDGNQFKRCAFRTGIETYELGNTTLQYEKAFASEHEDQKELAVWVDRSKTRCIVGFGRPGMIAEQAASLKEDQQENFVIAGVCTFLAIFTFTASAFAIFYKSFDPKLEYAAVPTYAEEEEEFPIAEFFPVGSQVEYFVRSTGNWIPAQVIELDPSSMNVMLNVKMGQWLATDPQSKRVRWPSKVPTSSTRAGRPDALE